MNVNFTNKVVLVTGASVGIGESTAILFAKLGAKLSIVGRNEENLRAVATKCEQQKGLKPLAIIADLATDEGVEKVAKDTLDHFGRLDVLVNNAGIGGRTTILTTDMEIFDKVFQLDVRSVYNLTRLLVPALIESKGNIINVSSVVATWVYTGNYRTVWLRLHWTTSLVWSLSSWPPKASGSTLSAPESPCQTS